MSVVSKKFSASLYSMLVLLLLCLVTAFSSGCGSKASLDPAKPVTLTIWHVYGNQTNSPFNDTIEKFNASEGKAKGVIVKVASVSSSNVIDKALFASEKQDPGIRTDPILKCSFRDHLFRPWKGCHLPRSNRTGYGKGDGMGTVHCTEQSDQYRKSIPDRSRRKDPCSWRIFSQ